MDAGLENVIRRALEDARAAGRDHLTQTEEAVRAGRETRPDLTASEALAAVRRLQQIIGDVTPRASVETVMPRRDRSSRR
jgi:hypothetical protein